MYFDLFFNAINKLWVEYLIIIGTLIAALMYRKYFND